MKTFTYTYRDKAGALKKSALQAADRLDALRQIRAMGCVPVSVTEGVFKTGSGLPLPFSPHLVVLTGCVVIFLAFLVVYRLKPGKTHPGRAERVSATVKHAPKALPAAAAKPDEPLAAAKSPTADKPVRPEKPAESKTVAARHGTGTGVPNAELPEAQKNGEEPGIRNMPTASEQLISMLGMPGEDTPPLPLSEEDTLETDFEKAITNTIYITDKDDEESAARKENVAWVKEYIKEAKKLGWTPGEYLRALEKKRKEEAAFRSEAHRLIGEIENETPEEAPAAREALNKELEKEGLLPLEEPAQE